MELERELGAKAEIDCRYTRLHCTDCCTRTESDTNPDNIHSLTVSQLVEFFAKCVWKLFILNFLCVN
jgi:hypothetical protein